MADLVQPQPRAVSRHQNRAVLQIHRLLQQRRDLLAREDLRQLLRGARPWNDKLRLAPLERDAVEEPQPLRHDVATRPGELPLFDQVQEVALDLPLADPVRAPSVVLREPRHRPQVRFARAYRHPANHQIPVHLLAQRTHRRLLVRMCGNSPATGR